MWTHSREPALEHHEETLEHESDDITPPPKHTEYSSSSLRQVESLPSLAPAYPPASSLNTSYTVPPHPAQHAF